jgi:hypothetical protein
VAVRHRRGIVGYIAGKDREAEVLRIMEALRSRVVDVGRSFHNANQAITLTGSPINIADLNEG